MLTFAILYYMLTGFVAGFISYKVFDYWDKNSGGHSFEAVFAGSVTFITSLSIIEVIGNMYVN